MNRQTVLVTGGQGFVGRYVCKLLVAQGYNVRIPTRRPIQIQHRAYEPVTTGDLSVFTDWSQLVRNVRYVVHLVARTHMTDEFGAAAMQAYRSTNVDITRRLAQAARNNGVQRMIYLSSIKAVGNSSHEPLTEQSPCEPSDSYGITKLEAEQTIQNILGQSDSTCSYTILRPPLVYGMGVRGNFLRLLGLVRRGIPLPRVENQRSMVHVLNLVDAIYYCLLENGAENQIFHIADPAPISTPELVSSMARGMAKTARFVPVPKRLLTGLGKVIGKEGEVRRLSESLVVSSEAIQHALNWEPRLTTPVGVTETAAAYAVAPWSDSQAVPTKAASEASPTATPTRTDSEITPSKRAA